MSHASAKLYIALEAYSIWFESSALEIFSALEAWNSAKEGRTCLLVRLFLCCLTCYLASDSLTIVIRTVIIAKYVELLWLLRRLHLLLGQLKAILHAFSTILHVHVAPEALQRLILFVPTPFLHKRPSHP